MLSTNIELSFQVAIPEGKMKKGRRWNKTFIGHVVVMSDVAIKPIQHKLRRR